MANNNIIRAGEHLFVDRDIYGGNIYLNEGIAGEELTVDTLTADVQSLPVKPVLLTDSSNTLLIDAERDLMASSEARALLTTLKYGQEVRYTHSSGMDAYFYVESVRRYGPTRYKLNCVSAVGLLSGTKHKGGLYTGQTAGEVLSDIIGGAINYTVADDVAAARVYGWLPYASRRDNLHQLLFALGANVVKLGSYIHIKYLDTDTQKTIAAERIYMGGDVSYSGLATEVQVTEHSFYSTANDNINTLFDNTDGSGAATNQMVIFSEPHHDLIATENLDIVESGVNYAVVTGTGTLTGAAYTHQTKVISRKSDVDTGAENVKTVANATLVSLVNSENVAARVLAYYGGAYQANMGIVAGEERPGDTVAYTNPFGEAASGIIKSMDINLSKTLKANAEITSGYVPTGGGNFFENLVVLTGSGTFTVPDGVTKLRAVLIGGGTGGASGTAGTGGTLGPYEQRTDEYNGQDAYFTRRYYGTSGKPGSGGAAGSGGKVHVVLVDVTEGQIITYKCGSGGSGGVSDGSSVPGKAGGATTFGSYTSSSGAAGTGFLELVSGKVYGAAGAAGIAGGTAQYAEKTAEGDGWNPYWDEYAVYPGGTVTYKGTVYKAGTQAQSGYGLGGGAAAGANGKASVDYFANGGDGATPVAPTAKTNIGEGGDGGHGGGAGGGNGEVMSWSYYGYPDPVSPVQGSGGAGGTGGDGGPGGIIIYY